MTPNAYIEAARSGKNALWRYLAGVMLVITALLILGTMAAALVMLAAGDFANPTALTNYMAGMMGFIAALAGLWAAVRGLHRRPFRSLISPGAIDLPRIGLVFVIWFGLCILGDLVLALLVTPGNYTWSFDAALFWPFAVASLALIPFQAGFEELFFRGYLLQGIGLRTARLWIPAVIQALFFALLHFWNPEMQAYDIAPMLLFYFSFGLFAAWLTLKTGGLEASMALHVANNLYASLAVTYSGSALETPTFFTIQKMDPWLSLLVFYLSAAVLAWVVIAVQKKRAANAL
ncbi:MAG TPA: type II CAAX endopeptidase family protein [Anaerolineaceae bacterium]|nr:type II CAAX endopeptidase family protein [Anaerolineaceae bacterium]HPN53748.1 type II CAAX endopeptidase family protein [Anaerolineaceae bacterium]